MELQNFSSRARRAALMHKRRFPHFGSTWGTSGCTPLRPPFPHLLNARRASWGAQSSLRPPPQIRPASSCSPSFQLHPHFLLLGLNVSRPFGHRAILAFSAVGCTLNALQACWDWRRLARPPLHPALSSSSSPATLLTLAPRGSCVGSS